MTQVWAAYLPNYTYRRIARGQQVDILTYLLIFLTFSQLPSLVARTNIQYTALALGKTNTAGSFAGGQVGGRNVIFGRFAEIYIQVTELFIKGQLRMTGNVIIRECHSDALNQLRTHQSNLSE